MSRADRRREQRDKEKSEKLYQLTEAQIRNIRLQGVKDAEKVAFVLMAYNPIMVLEGHFGELMKKEGRIERFIELLMNQYACFEDGYVTIQDMKDYLYEKYGLTIEFKLGKGDAMSR